MRYELFLDRDEFPRARVAAWPGRTKPNRKCAKASNLNAVSGRHPGYNRLQHGVDDLFDITLQEIGTLLDDALHKLGFTNQSLI